MLLLTYVRTWLGYQDKSSLTQFASTCGGTRLDNYYSLDHNQFLLSPPYLISSPSLGKMRKDMSYFFSCPVLFAWFAVWFVFRSCVGGEEPTPLFRHIEHGVPGARALFARSMNRAQCARFGVLSNRFLGFWKKIPKSWCQDIWKRRRVCHGENAHWPW